MHFHAPRLIALRGGDRNEETPARENEGEVPMRRANARALSPRELELGLTQSQVVQKPVLGGKVGARALRVRSVSRGENGRARV